MKQERANTSIMAEKDQQMQELRETFSERLRRARKMRGLSISELAKKMEGVVSSTAIEKYEKALMFPQSSAILIALAQVLQIPVGDLLKPITLNIDMTRFSFRKKSKLGKKAEESILMDIQGRIEKYVEIENTNNLSIPYISGVTDYVVDSADRARKAAQDIRKAWNLGNQPIAQPILLLEEHGIRVIEIEADPMLFDGNSNTVGGTPYIIINKKNKNADRPEEERRRLTLFHEFGHQYMNIPSSVDDKQKEDLCNIFASEMLIPSDEFINMVGEHRNSIYMVELRNIQAMYGISIRALMMKARQLNIISENTYRWFCINLNKNPRLKEYVDACLLKQFHSIRFEQIVFRSLAAETITSGKAAELLGITTAELNNRLNIA